MPTYPYLWESAICRFPLLCVDCETNLMPCYAPVETLLTREAYSALPHASPRFPLRILILIKALRPVVPLSTAAYNPFSSIIIPMSMNNLHVFPPPGDSSPFSALLSWLALAT